MKGNFICLGFPWTNRSSHCVADLVAKLAATASLPHNWVLAPPPLLAALIESEAPLTSI